MDLWDLARVMVRRWYLTVPLLLVVAACAWSAGERVNPTYTAETTILYVPPLQGEDETGVVNPWRETGLNTTAQAVHASVNGPETRRMLTAQGLSDRYSISLPQRSVLAQVACEASSITSAQVSLTGVVEAIVNDLRQKQVKYGVPTDGQITIDKLTGEGTIVETRSGYKEIIVVITGMGMLAVAGVALIIDHAATKRRRVSSRRKSAPERVPTL